MNEKLIDARGVVVAGAALAIASLIPVALYQTGMIAHLPDPPGAAFNSDRITASKDAHPFGIPDALLGLGSFGLTLALASVAKRSPMGRSLLRVKLVGDGSIAAFNVVKQVVKFRALCSWCTATALAAGLECFGGRRYFGRRK